MAKKGQKTDGGAVIIDDGGPLFPKPRRTAGLDTKLKSTDSLDEIMDPKDKKHDAPYAPTALYVVTAEGAKAAFDVANVKSVKIDTKGRGKITCDLETAAFSVTVSKACTKSRDFNYVMEKSGSIKKVTVKQTKDKVEFTGSAEVTLEYEK
ncbi:MAG: hypothetical protein R2729_31640 [Bryobacteraceae bacterium]